MVAHLCLEPKLGLFCHGACLGALTADVIFLTPRVSGSQMFCDVNVAAR